MSASISNIARLKLGHLANNILGRLLGRSHTPVLRLYHSYGDKDRILVMGHALRGFPPPPDSYHNSWLHNTHTLLRLFAVKRLHCAKVRIRLGDEVHEVQAADDGFFAAEWRPTQTYTNTWEDVKAELIDHPGISATGKIYMPCNAPFAVISDIDDTFLISHTDNIFRRLYLMLSKNPRTRKLFTGVADHYNALALAHTTADKPNPFFYVSSSEWNLYDYLKELCRYHKMPEGVFLLNMMKNLTSFWNSGGNNHDGKFTRVARILEEFPEQNYILMGDDSQRDPEIYSAIVRHFPGRVRCVYIRHRVKAHLEHTRKFEALMKAAGTEVCYFTHSKTALQHSRKFLNI